MRDEIIELIIMLTGYDDLRKNAPCQGHKYQLRKRGRGPAYCEYRAGLRERCAEESGNHFRRLYHRTLE